IVALAASPRFGKMLRRSITLITYTGRRSGRTFSMPVAYRRRGDEIEIVPNIPDAKTWWRNFLGDGAPMSLTLDGVERAGHAVAYRDENGRVTVRVRLSPQYELTNRFCLDLTRGWGFSVRYGHHD